MEAARLDRGASPISGDHGVLHPGDYRTAHAAEERVRAESVGQGIDVDSVLDDA